MSEGNRKLVDEVRDRITGDCRNVRGQAGARRALEIAATGGHLLLMMGLPGGETSMLAMRLPGLPPAGAGDRVTKGAEGDRQGDLS